MIPHESGRVRSGEISIHFRRLGNRGHTPILIVHGLQYFSWDWLGVAQALGAEREVLCMDMRGFGDSDWSAQKDYAVASMAQDIVAVLDHVDWQRVVLFGHSMGGRSTAYAAARGFPSSPARVAGLALLDYTPENAPAGTQRTTELVGSTPDSFPSLEAAREYLGPRKSTERYLQYLRNQNGRYSVKRDPYFRDQFRKVLAGGERPKLGVDLWQIIGEVRCPILSVRGSRSDMYAAESAARMKAANPKLSVVEVDAGHDLAGDNPRELTKVLEAWGKNL